MKNLSQAALTPYALLSLLVTPIVTMSYVMCETGFPGNISAKWGKCDIWEVEKFTFDTILYGLYALIRVLIVTIEDQNELDFLLHHIVILKSTWDSKKSFFKYVNNLTLSNWISGLFEASTIQYLLDGFKSFLCFSFNIK